MHQFTPPEMNLLPDEYDLLYNSADFYNGVVDQDPFAVACCRKFIYLIAFRRLGNSHDADDIAQDIWLKLQHRLPDSYTEERPFTSWLCVVTDNAAKDLIRWYQVRQQIRAPFDTQPNPPNRKQGCLPWELEELVQLLLKYLSNEHAAILRALADEKSQKQIAEDHGIPVGTMYRKIHEARKTAQRIVKRLVGEDE